MNTSDWVRGYFCAVAKMIELEGQVQPDAAELFRCGGDARRADLEDQEIFREHGLLPNTKGSRAEERKLTALTAERDQLRGALALGQQNCDDACDELRGDCDELRADVVRLTARAERAEAELAKERARLDWLETSDPDALHWWTVGEPNSIRADIDAAMKESAPQLIAERTDAIYQRACEVEHELRAELAAERARLDYLLQWDVTFHDRADIDAELSYAQRKKSTPTLS